MIPARKHRWFNAWFAAHARSRIHGTFGAVLARGVEAARALAAEAPLLLVVNHCSWWDPLVILHASQHLLGVDGHAMMDADNLRRLPFFALVGAFGVDLDLPSDGTAAIRYAARLLDRPGRAVWIFAQGRERPSDERPLGFRAGAAQIARVARRARVLPVALRYEFAGEERPRLYLAIGEPVAAPLGPGEAERGPGEAKRGPREPEAGRGGRDTEAACAAQEIAVTAELDRIQRAIRKVAGAKDLALDVDGFRYLHRAKPSVVGQAAERLLAHWTRPREPLTPRLSGGGRGDRS
ncbi:lysophospholipid acyltransferase family protein [Sorangium sp. So ce233]|uniref:lysophospholipid acyltransferase family protein n=1 Tax=Sorangium sp. So ce233 TaxID=3133290 RepID=UPI003F5E4ACF